MRRLKVYEQDYRYRHHWHTIYSTPKKAMKYVKKLLRHFKLKTKVYFDTNKLGYASDDGYIQLPKKDISLAIIAHEIGHLLAYKNGQNGHTKKAYKYIHKVYRYSIKYIPIEILFNLILNKNTLLLK